MWFVALGSGGLEMEALWQSGVGLIGMEVAWDHSSIDGISPGEGGQIKQPAVTMEALLDLCEDELFF